jgi:Domain of unknown function DUF1828
MTSMIADNIIEKVRSQISEAIVIEHEGRNALSIGTPFVFEDGDPCAFLLVKGGKGAWRLDDEGGTIRRAGLSGPDLLGPSHVERLKKIVGFYGLSENKGVLSLSVSGDGFGDAVCSFTQACLEIINLAKLPKERPEGEKTDFHRRLTSLVESAVPEDRRVARWHHPELDAEKVYHVDYMIRGKSHPLYVFGVNSPTSAHLATIACYHYKNAGADFRSLAIYDKEEKLRVRETVPLNEVVDKKFPRVRERKSIREFLAAEAA